MEADRARDLDAKSSVVRESEHRRHSHQAIRVTVSSTVCSNQPEAHTLHSNICKTPTHTQTETSNLIVDS